MSKEIFTYSRTIREQIHHLRDIAGNEEDVLSFLKQKISNGLKLKDKKREPSFDDLVFLPANLTRLVIDPYREKCNTRTVIGEKSALPLKIDSPIIIGGLLFSEMSEDLRNKFSKGAVLEGIGLRVPISTTIHMNGVKVIGVVPLKSEILTCSIAGFSSIEIEPDNPNVPLNEVAIKDALEVYRSGGVKVPIGITIGPNFVPENIKIAVKTGLDFVTLSAVERLRNHNGIVTFSEDKIPRIDVIAEAVETLRAVNHEEDIDLVYFGGIRSGDDIAKALALGAKAVMIGEAAHIAVEADLSMDSSANYLSRLVKAFVMETVMLTCCCGKTDVHNLEPEDLRSLTIETSISTGIPVVGRDQIFR